MKNHTNDCEVTLTGVCTCMVTEPHPHPGFAHRFGRPPRDAQELADWIAVEANKGRGKAGTSRYVDTEPRVTWLGDTMHTHPPTCGVYKSPEPNWAPYCDCWIAVKQRQPPTEPGDPTDAAPHVPKEYRPVRLEAPPWAWMLIGAGAGAITTATTWALWPW